MTRARVEHDPRVTVWADGFGRWHARVPRHAAAPLLAARRAIRDELAAREDITRVNRHYWSCLDHVYGLDDDASMVYAEPRGDSARCMYGPHASEREVQP